MLLKPLANEVHKSHIKNNINQHLQHVSFNLLLKKFKINIIIIS